MRCECNNRQNWYDLNFESSFEFIRKAAPKYNSLFYLYIFMI